MSLVRRLYEQFRQLIHEGVKFLVVGGVGLVITNAVYALLRHYSVGPVTSTTVATIVATVVTYVGNRYWSFRERERVGVAREGIIFLVLNGIGLLIQDVVVAFNAYALGLEHNRAAQFIALNTGIALATLFRFWSYRKWVWAAPAQDAAAGPVPAEAAQAGVNGVPRPGTSRAQATPLTRGVNVQGTNGDGRGTNGDGRGTNGDGRRVAAAGHRRPAHRR